MKITNVLKSIIVEDSRFDVLYNKTVEPQPSKTPGKSGKGLMAFEVLKDIIFADPTTKTPDNFDMDGASVEDMKSNNVKVGKFTNWLLKNYLKPGLNVEDPKSPEYKSALKEYRRVFLEDLFKMTDLLTKYERIKGQLPEDKRDINKLTPESLTDTIVNLPEDIKKRLEKNLVKSDKREMTKSNRFAHPGAEIVHQGSRYTLIKIDGTGDPQREAAGWYGGYYDYMNGESHWCTSPPGSNYFMTYAKQGPLYVVMANDDKGLVGAKTGLPQERYQFHFPSSQFMDRMDRQIDLVAFLNGPGAEMKELFKTEFAKGLIAPNTSKVEFNYPNSAAGKYVALYGFEDLFDSLPDSIEQLMITNSSNQDIALDIPESLGRFRNLEALMLQKMVKTLPNSIGNLKNLQFISLGDNKQLTSLPESIADIDSLMFLILQGSNPNVHIPERLKEKLTSEGDGFYSAL